MAQSVMTTQELDETFCHLQGVEQFVCGNIALARYGRFFLNLADGEKLSILYERGHVFQQADGVGKTVVQPPADNWNGLHRVLPQPRKTKDKKASAPNAPVQMRLW